MVEADKSAVCFQFIMVFLMLHRRKHKNCKLVPLENHTQPQATGGKQGWKPRKQKSQK